MTNGTHIEALRSADFRTAARAWKWKQDHVIDPSRIYNDFRLLVYHRSGVSNSKYSKMSSDAMIFSRFYERVQCSEPLGEASNVAHLAFSHSQEFIPAGKSRGKLRARLDETKYQCFRRVECHWASSMRSIISDVGNFNLEMKSFELPKNAAKFGPTIRVAIYHHERCIVL